MENFVQYNPTKLIFGREVIDGLPEEIFWKKALVIIGEASAKKNGLYARVVSLMNMAGLDHITYEGVKASATFEDADKATAVAKQYQAEVVIAIGGCSVIDVAKAVAVGYYSNCSISDFYELKAAPPTQALPILNILTIASTGSAMNNHSVLCNPETGIKKGFNSPLFYPKSAFLDPCYTVSVPKRLTVSGVSIMIAHAIQQFLNKGDAELTDHLTANHIRLSIRYGKEVIENPQDYQIRANLMWLATVALNDTLSSGKVYNDKSIITLAHALDVLYEIGHGTTLAIVLLAWLKYYRKQLSNRIAFLGKHVFDLSAEDQQLNAENFIQQLENFYTYANIATRLSEVGIRLSEKQKITDSFRLNHTQGDFKVALADYEGLLELMW